MNEHNPVSQAPLADVPAAVVPSPKDLEVDTKQAQRRNVKAHGYSRKVPLPKDKQDKAMRAVYLAGMRAHFKEVNSYKALTPAVEPYHTGF